MQSDLAPGPAPPGLRVWVTRSAPGAQATAARLRARGHDPLVAPLIAAAPLAAVAPDLDAFGALAFTSAAGVRAFAALAARRDRPAYAVGGATAAAARDAGFVDVRDADGDGEALAALLRAHPPAGAVLAPGAREPAFDLRGALAAAGVEVRPWPVYATAAVAPPPAGPLAALGAGRVGAVLLQSASAARAFDDATGGLRPRAWIAALSDACRPADPAWPVRVAEGPREVDLLRLLDGPAPLDSPPRPR